MRSRLAAPLLVVALLAYVLDRGAALAWSQRLSGTLDLGTADVVFTGVNAYDYSGASVASAGDVNGDGLADLLIGASHAGAPQADSGDTYLVYGRAGPMQLSGTVELAVADVVFRGANVADYSGSCVSSAGDVNGDGLADLLIGAYGADPGGDSSAGVSYLVYGRSGVSQLSGVFSLAGADVKFYGIDANDYSGRSVSSAGDVNGDGLADLLIGAYGADPGARQRAGETYLVYGRSGASQLSGGFNLANADVVFNGIDADDYSGYSASSAGDVNGDGLDDILIGAYHAHGGYSIAGETYLVYGRSAGQLSGSFDLANADVLFLGIDINDESGWSVSSAGDVNGDGLFDLLIGAHRGQGSEAGETYLIYGRSGSAQLSGTFGLRDADAILQGIDLDDRSGSSVASAGDIDGDGLDDLLIGALFADPGGDSYAGETYLIVSLQPNEANHGFHG